MISFTGYNYWLIKDKVDAGDKFDLKILRPTKINEEKIRAEYYATMKDKTYLFYIWGVFALAAKLVQTMVFKSADYREEKLT